MRAVWAVWSEEEPIARNERRLRVPYPQRNTWNMPQLAEHASRRLSHDWASRDCCRSPVTHAAFLAYARMPVTVGDTTTYVVGKPTKSAICIQCPVRKSWHIFKRHANATDAMMQQRILDEFWKASEPSTPQPSSPSNPRSAPSSGSKRPKDKLSPPSVANSMPPPPPKRPSTHGSKLFEARKLREG